MTQGRALETKRLRLRPFQRGDEAEFARHLGDWEITRQLALNPHPFDSDHAEGWIDECLAQPNGPKYGLRFAVEASGESGLVGSAGLSPAVWAPTVWAPTVWAPTGLAPAGGTSANGPPAGAGFELGYWIGRAYWGRGYATEAALAVINHGFNTLDIGVVVAQVFGENPASVRVLEKIGFELAETVAAPETEDAERAVQKYFLRRPD